MVTHSKMRHLRALLRAILGLVAVAVVGVEWALLTDNQLLAAALVLGATVFAVYGLTHGED